MGERLDGNTSDLQFYMMQDGELEEKATCREFRQVRTEDKLE